jgi:hypothetical protein
VGIEEAKRSEDTAFDTAVAPVYDPHEELHRTAAEVMLALADRTRVMVMVIGIIAVVVGVVMTPLITRSIVRPIRGVT